MDSLPPDFSPYMVPSRPTIECVISESSHYGIPVPVTLAIMKTEGGKPGQEVANKNQSKDLGVMQINEIHIPAYARKTGLSAPTLRRLLVQNGCFSVSVALDILSSHLKRTGSMVEAVAAYHSRTPHLGAKYVRRVEASLRLLNQGEMPAVLYDAPVRPITKRSG